MHLARKIGRKGPDGLMATEYQISYSSHHIAPPDHHMASTAPPKGKKQLMHKEEHNAKSNASEKAMNQWNAFIEFPVANLVKFPL